MKEIPNDVKAAKAPLGRKHIVKKLEKVYKTCWVEEVRVWYEEENCEEMAEK